MEVSPLSSGANLEPLSVPITGSAFAFSILLYPQSYRLSLRSAFQPKLEDLRAYHVSLSSQCGLGFASLPAVLMSMCPQNTKGQPTAYHFGAGLSATLACSTSRHLSAIHITLTIPHEPSSPATLLLVAYRFHLTASA